MFYWSQFKITLILQKIVSDWSIYNKAITMLKEFKKNFIHLIFFFVEKTGWKDLLPYSKYSA